MPIEQNQIIRIPSNHAVLAPYFASAVSQSLNPSTYPRYFEPKFKSTPFFQHLLNPISVMGFGKRYYEKRTMWLSPSRTRLDLHVALKIKAESILQSAALPLSAMKFKDKWGRDMDDNMIPRFLKNHSLQDFLNLEGGSIIINSLHCLYPEYGALAWEFQRALGIRININCYMTPPGVQTFPCHWDGHDVFIFQVQGKKHWQIYEPMVTLPKGGSPPKCNVSSAAVQRGMVFPGSLLYLPRGVPHQGVAQDDMSFHLTIGLHPIRAVDLLRTSTKHFLASCEEDPRLRQSIPPVAIEDPARFPRTFDHLSRIVKEHEHRQNLYLQWQLKQSNDLLESHYQQVYRSDKEYKGLIQNPETIYRRTDIPILIDPQSMAPSLRIILGHDQVVVPRNFERALIILNQRSSVNIHDLVTDGLSRREVGNLLMELLRSGVIAPSDSEVTIKQRALALRGHIPLNIEIRGHKPCVVWTTRENRKFRKPFFFQHFEPAEVNQAHVSPLESLPMCDAGEARRLPVQFIFHTSRCGSTLISQLLACQKSNLLISEPSSLNQLLGVSLDIGRKRRISLLRRLVKAYSDVRLPEEKKLIFKCTSWNVLDLDLITEAFPNAPWVFLHRDPLSVIASNHCGKPSSAEDMDFILRRVSSLPGLPASGLNQIEQLSCLLSGYYKKVLNHLSNRPSSKLGRVIDYADIAAATPKLIMSKLGMPMTREEEVRMEKRRLFYSKDPQVRFEGTHKTRVAKDFPRWALSQETLGALMESYRKIKNRRISRQER